MLDPDATGCPLPDRIDQCSTGIDEAKASAITEADRPADHDTDIVQSVRFLRITTREHLARLATNGRAFHAESRFGHIPFSEEKFLRAYDRLITRPGTTFGILIERGDEILGVMGAEIGEYYLGTGILIATNNSFYVSQSIRGSALGGRVAVKLIRLFIDWAKAKGADELNVHTTSGIAVEQTDRFILSRDLV